MRFSSVSLIILFFSIEIYCHSLEFIREDVAFTIQDSFFYVDGIYYICNVSDKPVNNMLYYPFPEDSLYGEVDSVLIYNLIDSIPEEIIKRKTTGFFFNVSLEPFRVGKYRIFYKQKLYGNKAEYILTTVKYWRKPLQIANFQLGTSNNIEIDSLSYKPDSSYVGQNKRKYFWYRSNFMPDRNFIILFDRK
ncbi:MAG: hypothetical protein ISS28_03170 [Candidatus Cloacimonetes bacterium]|nr:hypothetical protein [Candidatus Cloacimonadota bacterium]MBL7086092.1 hypothetical protein [Candidatus Cloacimonadota bacterium]